MLVIAVATALMLKAVADLMLAYADQAQEIGHLTSPDIVANGRTD